VPSALSRKQIDSQNVLIDGSRGNLDAHEYPLSGNKLGVR
jgi:hypothetical protein